MPEKENKLDPKDREESLTYIAKIVEGKQLQTDPFGQNSFGARIYRRAERISLALGLVTKHLSTEEPLRTSIRSSAIKLLSSILSARDELRSMGSQKVASVKALLREMISLLRIAAVSDYISLQNAEFIIEALDQLGTLLDNANRSNFSENLLVSKDDLSDIQNIEDTRKNIKDSLVPIKDRVDLKDNSKRQHTVLYEGSKRILRGTGILETLRTGTFFSVKDISASMPEYSEKMIQRELLLLVSQGLVKKTGAKRWSKYSAAPNS